MNKLLIGILLTTGISINVITQKNNLSSKIEQKDFDPATLMWYDAPAAAWEEDLPVGNGRLGARIFGKYGEEKIQMNEETYWSGGPYSTVVKGGADALPQIQKYIFEGQPIEGHKLFGRVLMGYPVEQQKYQSLANLHLFFENQKEVTGYILWIKLKTEVAGTEYTTNGLTYRREVLSHAPDNVIAVWLAENKLDSLTFSVQLSGCRNINHSNYATDYFN